MSKVIIKELNKGMVEQNKDTLLDMFYENTYKFHYPEKATDLNYIESKYEQLVNFVQEENTFFIGAFIEEQLVGFIWIYKTNFMDHMRMRINSFFVSEEYRSHGIGKQLMDAAVEKSISEGCSAIATHHAYDNEGAGRFYHKNGFSNTRIEVVKEL